MPLSADTLLRAVRSQEVAGSGNPRVIGVDDWAIHKNFSYGTIIVDLETRRVVELLEGRDARTLEEWRLEHPEVEIVARDRWTDYAKALRIAAPNAIQVADRWHLLNNLTEMLTRWLQTEYHRLKQLPLAEDLQAERAAYSQPQLPRTRLTKAQQVVIETNRARRQELFEEARRLHAQGLGILPISKQLGIHRHTVRVYIRSESLPEYHPRMFAASILDPSLDYLQRRHAEGCENASQLWREIKAQGFPGQPWQVIKWMSIRRRTPALSSPRGNKAVPKHRDNTINANATTLPLPSAKHLAWLLLQDATSLSPQDELLQRHLLRDRQVLFVQQHARTFRHMVNSRQADALTSWLETCQSSGIAALMTFAQGLKNDFSSVQAALELPWSNGQTEGQVTRLKMIKRQIYGRAKFDLLRQKVLLAA